MKIEKTPSRSDNETETEKLAKVKWEGVRGWTSFSGTGIQEQIAALDTNLETFLPKLETIVGEYQTDLIEDQKTKELIQSARIFLEEAKKFLAGRQNKFN